MGGASSRAARKLSMTWNIENRAQNAIDKMNKNPEIHVQNMAPKHESTKQLIEDFQKEHPELLDEQRKKHDGLDSRLKGMEVQPEKFGEIRPKLLPESRSSVLGPDYGYYEPPQITMGRCSIRQALKFLDSHHVDPKKHSVETIGEEYNLDSEKVAKILKYFRMHTIKILEDPRQKARAARLKASETKDLPSGSADSLQPGKTNAQEPSLFWGKTDESPKSSSKD